MLWGFMLYSKNDFKNNFVIELKEDLFKENSLREDFAENFQHSYSDNSNLVANNFLKILDKSHKDYGVFPNLIKSSSENVKQAILQDSLDCIFIVVNKMSMGIKNKIS